MKDRLTEIRVLFRKELLEILRDRRAAFFTFVFPLVMYPILFALSGKFHEWKDSRNEDREIRLGLSGDYYQFFPLLEDGDDIEVVFDSPVDPDLFVDGQMDALIAFGAPDTAGGVVPVTVHFDGATPMSKQALSKVREVLVRYDMHLLEGRFRDRGVRLQPASLVQVSRNDVSEAQERGEAFLARILPALLILLFFTGGAFAAIDLVAGEKERKTLETLFVHPVTAENVAVAKFLVLNLVGMGIAYKLGLNTAAGWLSELTFPSWEWLALAMVLFLPMAVLTSSVLLAISSIAHSFREAQTYLIPVMLGGLLPALLCAAPHVELNVATALIPIGNIALAVRDTISGDVRWGGCLVAFASTTFYAVLTVRWSSRLLTREETLVGVGSESRHDGSAGQARARRALIFSTLLLLVVYYGGGFLQNPHGPLGIPLGLATTLWVLVFLPALIFTFFGNPSFRESWGLRKPNLGDVALSLLVAPAAVVLVTYYMMLQNQWLPLSEGLQESFKAIFSFEEIHPGVIVAVFVLSPALCEECLWRGAVQGELMAARRPLRAIALVALFFGLFHFSFHRLIPTALVGGLLACVRWRSGSLINCILVHGLYNALIIFAMAPLVEAQDPTCDTLFHPFSLAVCCGVLFLAWRWMGAARRSRLTHDNAAP